MRRSREEGIAWTPQEVPDLTGRRALVTGVTSGLGEATVLELVGRGAEVVMAARHQDKLAAAVADVQRRVPAAVVHPLLVDLADLTSVRRAADEARSLGSLHLLVNNAGVMATPYQRTTDGFELQLGTNHFGPFALTGLLMPLLLESGDARVVSVASQAHRMALRAPLDDPRLQERRYRRWQAYAESKLANLLFTYELERRARAAGLPLKALAAHPGYSSTSLMGAGRTAAGEGDEGPHPDPVRGVRGGRPERRDGRAADGDGRDRRPSGRHLRRATRVRGDARDAEGRRHPQARP